MILARGKSCPAWEGPRELWPGTAWAKRTRARAREGGEGRDWAEKNQEQAFLPNWLMASCPACTRLAHREDSFSMAEKCKSGQWKNRKQTVSRREAWCESLAARKNNHDYSSHNRISHRQCIVICLIITGRINNQTEILLLPTCRDAQFICSILVVYQYQCFFFFK